MSQSQTGWRTWYRKHRWYNRTHRLANRPLGAVRAWASVGVDPAETGPAPTRAIPQALARAGLGLGDVDLFEINEAFAAMCVATIRVLDLAPDRVNVSGSGCSLGHPIAVAAMYAGGGIGSATVLEVSGP